LANANSNYPQNQKRSLLKRRQRKGLRPESGSRKNEKTLYLPTFSKKESYTSSSALESMLRIHTV
jgi:hypothetical protein